MVNSASKLVGGHLYTASVFLIFRNNTDGVGHLEWWFRGDTNFRSWNFGNKQDFREDVQISWGKVVGYVSRHFGFCVSVIQSWLSLTFNVGVHSWRGNEGGKLVKFQISFAFWVVKVVFRILTWVVSHGQKKLFILKKNYFDAEKSDSKYPKFSFFRFVAPLQQTCVIVQTFARRRRNLFWEGKNMCLRPWGHFSGIADHKQ